jgi:hypothetical protein
MEFGYDGSVNMISALANELFFEIDAVTNTDAAAYPWWSLITAYIVLLITVYPDNHDYFGLGDSFSAGIGAGARFIPPYKPDYADPARTCAKCVGAYPNQIQVNGEGLSDSYFQFYSCSGGKTDSIIGPPGPGKTIQVALIKKHGRVGKVGFSTLSIGGNNVGFTKVLTSCILWNKLNCEFQCGRTMGRISGQGTGPGHSELQANLTGSYI